MQFRGTEKQIAYAADIRPAVLAAAADVAAYYRALAAAARAGTALGRVERPATVSDNQLLMDRIEARAAREVGFTGPSHDRGADPAVLDGAAALAERVAAHLASLTSAAEFLRHASGTVRRGQPADGLAVVETTLRNGAQV